MSSKFRLQRSLSGLAIAGCLVAGIPALSLAQGLPGLTLWGGVKGEDNLNFRLDYGGRAGAWDRYRLRIPAKKMKLAVAQFAISYPDYYKGEFDPKDVEVIVQDKSVPLQEVNWNKENNLIEIFPVDPVPAGSKVEIQLSNVRNPSFGGMFYFNCQVLSPGDVPLLRYLGTWVITIS
ncbi:MAG: DUF2808 domain-containing protein [Leptolyngbyaceae cyanobacterium HOT.MB2.61]|jgi:hypothetical protein|nr:DUF2808 domain-containing protein [Leptolyngbyaceae cyanobacterium HOT.MB2.61]